MRPNAITLEPSAAGSFSGEITHTAYLGDHVEYEVKTQPGRSSWSTGGDGHLRPKNVAIAFKERALPSSTVSPAKFATKGFPHDFSRRPRLESPPALAETIGRGGRNGASIFFARRETLIIETKRDPQTWFRSPTRSRKSIRDRIAEGTRTMACSARSMVSFPALRLHMGGRSGSTARALSSTACPTGASPSPSFMPAYRCWGSRRTMHGELYAAALGLGARLNGKALTLDGFAHHSQPRDGLGANNYVKPAFVGQMVENLLEARQPSCARSGHSCLPMSPPAVWWAITSPICSMGLFSPATVSSRKRAAGTCPSH